MACIRAKKVTKNNFKVLEWILRYYLEFNRCPRILCHKTHWKLVGLVLCLLLLWFLRFRILQAFLKGMASERRAFSLPFFPLPSEVTFLFLVKQRLNVQKQVEGLRNANINNSKYFSWFNSSLTLHAWPDVCVFQCLKLVMVKVLLKFSHHVVLQSRQMQWWL